MGLNSKHFQSYLIFWFGCWRCCCWRCCCWEDTLFMKFYHLGWKMSKRQLIYDLLIADFLWSDSFVSNSLSLSLSLTHTLSLSPSLSLLFGHAILLHGVNFTNLLFWRSHKRAWSKHEKPYILTYLYYNISYNLYNIYI